MIICDCLATYRESNKFYRYNFGSLLLRAEQFEASVEQFRNAVRIDPDYTDAQYNLGAAYVNHAVWVDDEYYRVDDSLRNERDNLTPEQISSKETEMSGLIVKRKYLFIQAVEPLEKARSLSETDGIDKTSICQTLFQAYVKANDSEKAETIQVCAGCERSYNQPSDENRTATRTFNSRFTRPGNRECLYDL